MKKPLKEQLASVKDKIELAESKAYLMYINKNLVSTRKRSAGWTVPGTPERDMMSQDRYKMIALARQKVEESPFAAGLVQSLVDNVIGTGYRLNMQTEDENWNEEVEWWWHDKKDLIDIRGIRTFEELQRMWETRRVVDGDVFLLFPQTESIDYIQTIEADRVWKLLNGGDDGLEFDDNGKLTKVWISKRKDIADRSEVVQASEEYPAENIEQYMENGSERAERVRGVSMLLQCLNVLEDIEEILEGMTLKVKKESFYGLTLKKNATPSGTVFGKTIDQITASEDGKSRRHVRLVPGMNLRLNPDEDATFLESKSPNSEFISFLKLLFRYVGVRFGLPLELVLIDFSETNYSSARGGMELAKKRFRVMQDAHARLISKVFLRMLNNDIKRRVLHPPSDLKHINTHTWNKPGWPYLDPEKEIAAAEGRLRNYLTTYAEELSNISSADLEDIIRKRIKEDDMLRPLMAAAKQKVTNENG